LRSVEEAADTENTGTAEVAQAMMTDEKAQLLALPEHRGTWCRDAEARDASGNAVTYDDAMAVAWDITGAICRLFGWQRASVLFGQVKRHLMDKRRSVGWPPRDTGMEAVITLQDFNDRADTTFDRLQERLEAMPVWSSGSRTSKSAAEA
jgi:hypothetical protein